MDLETNITARVKQVREKYREKRKKVALSGGPDDTEGSVPVEESAQPGCSHTLAFSSQVTLDKSLNFSEPLSLNCKINIVIVYTSRAIVNME